MDYDRVKIADYNGAMYVEAYMDDEMSLEDLNVVRSAACKLFSCPVDVIWKKVGSYSVSIDVQKLATEGIKEFRNFVYVASEPKKRQIAEFALESYMESCCNARIATSKEDAFALIKSTTSKLGG
jgi:hypothetical protein